MILSFFALMARTHGFLVEVFETEEQARAAAPPEGVEAPGVTMGSIKFGEVIASA